MTACLEKCVFFCLDLFPKTDLSKNDVVVLTRELVENRTFFRQGQQQCPELRFGDLARRSGGVKPLAATLPAFWKLRTEPSHAHRKH